MRTIVPYTRLEPQVTQALAGHQVEFVDVSGSDTAYFDLLAGLWAAGETFAVIEQDIVIRRDTLQAFQECGRAWCTAGYPYLGSVSYHGLGCCRFRASLMHAIPDLMDRVATHKYDGHTLRHWCILDAAIQRELWKDGRATCTAHGPVWHLNDRVSHGCVPGFA